MKNKKAIIVVSGIIAIITIGGISTYQISFAPKLKTVKSAHSKLDKQIDKTQNNLSSQIDLLPKIVSANEPVPNDYKAAKATLEPQIAKYNKANSQFKSNNTNVTVKTKALQSESTAIAAIISQIQEKYSNKMFNGDSGKYMTQLTSTQSQLETLKTNLNKEVVNYNKTINNNKYKSAANFKKYKPARKLKTTNTVVSPIQSLIP